MIAVELGSVIADEPLVPTGQHARASCQPTRLAVGEYGVDRLVYLPGIALVVAVYMDTTAVIIPIEHVWHMSTRGGVNALELLGRVLA